MSLSEKHLKDFYCEQPFTSLELHLDSKAYVCCPTWIKTDVGNFKEEDIGKLWNSEIARDIRKSIIDGSYSHCNKDLCPHIQGHLLKKHFELDRELRDIIENKQTEMSSMPRSVMFTFDPSCNLACPSCRSEKLSYTIDSDELTKTNQVIEKITLELFRNPLEKINLNITGSGDPFAALAFRSFLEKIDGSIYPNLRFDFQTNGLLLTPRMWERMHKIHKNINSILVSIDAASKETYAKVRKGGDWNTLIENMKFLSQLRFRQKKIIHLQVNFIVQQSNYREMASFVRMFKEIKVDRIYFSLISDWGVMSEEVFKKEAIWDSNHPDHSHFLNVLADPIFEFSVLGNVGPFRKTALLMYSNNAFSKKISSLIFYKIPADLIKLKKKLYLIYKYYF